jgi:uncharacterized protein
MDVTIPLLSKLDYQNRPTLTDCCFLTIPSSGFRLTWEVTQFCPHECEYCFTWSSPKRAKSEADLLQVAKRLMQLTDRIEVNDVLITGGEPLSVLDEITPFLEFLRLRGITFSVSTTLPTSRLLERICDLGPRVINLSVDPPTSESTASSFKADFGRLSAKLSAVGRKGVAVKLTATITRSNYENVPVLLEYLRKELPNQQHVVKVAFNREYPIGHSASANPLSKSDLTPTFNVINEWTGTANVPVSMANWSEFHHPLQECPAATHLISVMPNGDVTPCSLLYNVNRSFRIGNLISDPVEVIEDRLILFGEDVRKYNDRTGENTKACKTCQVKGSCGGGCLATHPIVSPGLVQRTCEISPKRPRNPQHALIVDLHRSFHEVYAPNPRVFASPSETLDGPLENRIREHVKRKLRGADLAHSFEHIERVVELARYISEREGGSPKITLPAAYFHDLAPREPAMHHMHTFRSAVLAREFLERTKSFTEDELLHIQYAIYTSSYGTHLLGYQPLSLEARIVRDSDWIDAIGAVGIGRTFAFHEAHGSGGFGYPEHDPEEFHTAIDMNVAGIDDTPIGHFFSKLLKIQPLLTTETGRILGRDRHNFMIAFIKQFKAEIDLKVEPRAQLTLPLGISAAE